MNVEEYLERDNSFLIIPRKTDNERSRSFWRTLFSKKASPSIASTVGNQRYAYEQGFKAGWIESEKDMTSNMSMPNPVSITFEERDKMMLILRALGYEFVYVNYTTLLNQPPGISPGLNMCKSEYTCFGADKRRMIMDKIIKIIESEIWQQSKKEQ
ncbi:MAG: hypothetical protein MJZ12_00100 [Prevotella sp.]|nr:hypothetical protein [Prevotella sp.]